jgi:hypothetical protein
MWSICRFTRITASTDSLIWSIIRRLMFSVNSILRISFDSSTRARNDSHRTRRYLRLSRVVVPRGVLSSFSLHFSTACQALRTASIWRMTCLLRSSIFSSVSSSSTK